MVEYVKYFIELAFSLGLFVNAVLFASQAVKLFKTKNSNDLSVMTFAGLNVKQIFSVLHGYINDDLIFMYGIIPGFISCGLVVFFIFFYRRNTA